MVEQFELVSIPTKLLTQALVRSVWHAQRYPGTLRVSIGTVNVVHCTELPDGSELPVGIAAQYNCDRSKTHDHLWGCETGANAVLPADTSSLFSVLGSSAILQQFRRAYL